MFQLQLYWQWCSLFHFLQLIDMQWRTLWVIFGGICIFVYLLICKSVYYQIQSFYWVALPSSRAPPQQGNVRGRSRGGEGGNSCCVTGAGEGGSSYCHTGRRPWTQGWKIFATLTLDWKWTPSFLGYWRSKVSLGGRITMKMSHIETSKGLEKQSCGYMRWEPPMPGSGRDF